MPQPSASLRELMDTVAALPTPDLPAAWPDRDETVEHWSVQVGAVREAHERCAQDAAAALAGGAPPDAVPLEVGGVQEVADGAVRARVYTPLGDGPFPGLVTLHGGGFWIGGGPVGMAAADPSCRLLCSRLGAVVVNVDYRQAPEHRFPTALEDSYAATLWLADQATDLRVDTGRLAVIGPSAGANLAAGVALLARDRGAPPLCLVVLMVPTLDATLTSSSHVENGTGYDLTEDYVETAWRLYLGPDGDPTSPLASPLLHPDLSGLAPAHIVVAEFDPLRDDGIRYAQRLADAGVRATLERHAMGHTVVTPEVAVDYLEGVLARLREAFTR